jgi:hypothetical protein
LARDQFEQMYNARTGVGEGRYHTCDECRSSFSCNLTDEQRFWSKVQKTEGCWLWKARLRPDGYGEFSAGGRLVRAHRFAYELAIGPIPEGMEIDHVKARGCTSRACVNPAHLEAVTGRENTMRGAAPSIVLRNSGACIHGHLMTEANTYCRKDRPGQRMCRECKRIRDRKNKRSHHRSPNGAGNPVSHVISESASSGTEPS